MLNDTIEVFALSNSLPLGLFRNSFSYRDILSFLRILSGAIHNVMQKLSRNS